MVLTRPTNFALSRQQMYNLTHFLCIPLVTASSRPLLQSSLGLLRDNLAFASIPPGAFVPIGTLHWNLGVAMSQVALITQQTHSLSDHLNIIYCLKNA